MNISAVSQYTMKPLTFTSPLYLPHTVQSIRHQVWQPAIQINWCQATLESLLGMNQLWQLLEQLLWHSTNVEITWKDRQEEWANTDL